VNLVAPTGVAAIASGGFLIADTGANLVLRVSAVGQLTIIAGTGVAGLSGDGGSALSATLNAPTRVLPTPDGSFLILDSGNQVVRRVSASGVISTVLASDTTLDHDIFGQLVVNPGGLAQDQAGDIFVFDGRQVVEVSPTGHRTVIAGTGDCVSNGDGGPATNANFATPSGLAFTQDGLLVADYNNQAAPAGNVRLIATDQTITTVAGEANTGHCVGAGGAPTGSLWPIFYITAPSAAHAHRPIAIRFVTTLASSVQTSLLQGSRRIRRLLRPASLGLNTVTLAGVPNGLYTMEITSSATVNNNNADQGGALTLHKRFTAPLKVN
jgi:hypothetical protein